MDRQLEYAERYAALGISLQWVCGPKCDTANHGRDGHPPEAAGKIPLRAGWQRAGYRSYAELRRDYTPGNNLSVLTGYHEGARLCVAVVDLDSDAALAWGNQHLPATPWRVKTRRGEHWYYRCAAPVASRDMRRTTLALDMEVKGNGTHVVAASSTHRCGHVYEEVTERPWYADHVRELPLYDASWFPAPGHARSDGSAAGTHEPKAPTGGTWPGERTFCAEDYHEAWERAIAYLECCPPSRSGHGGDQTLYDVATKLLRGWPLATPERWEELRAAGKAAPVNAVDAQRAAVSLLRACYNPRCLDADGETPYPWDDDRLWYKVGQAATATRLPGPDYWLFDDTEHRIKWAQMNKKMPPSAATDGGEQEIPMDETTTTSKVSQDADGSNAFAGLPPDARVFGSTEPVEDDRPAAEITVHVGTNLLKMAADAEKALAHIPDVYVMSGKIHDMVREVGTDKHGYGIRPYCRPTPRGHLVALLSAHSKWVSVVKGKGDDDGTPRTVRPDSAAVTALMEAGTWPSARRLHGLVYTPVVRADGSILQRPGYDHQSGLYYHDELRMKPIQTTPSRKACADALRVLLDVVADFPFADPALARSVWLSAVLTRFCRHAFRGSVPMFAVSANVAGGGKGKLVDAASIICDGRPAAKVSFHGNPEEDERVITAHLRDSTPSVCLDNIDKDLPLASSAYEMLLTTPTFTSRVIKTSTMFRCEYPDAAWWATGNTLRTAGDMSRRVLRIDIADMSGSPKDRKAKHADLEAYCLANRDRLVRAALTLLSGWYAAGKPQAQLVPLASYDAWSGIVRNCVVWCGLPDPGLALGKDSEDETASKRSILFRHLLKVGQFLPGQLAARLATDRAYSAEHSDLYSFLSEEGVPLMKAGKSDGKSFGRWLTPHVGPVETIDGKRYQLAKKPTNAGAAYLVRELS